jgi:hypothetical protein
MGFGDWINRKRHNRGFGIQSPSAFFFITQVLRERLPYYAYEELDRSIDQCGGMSRRGAKELFRITNSLHPANCIAMASEAAATAMKAARPGAHLYRPENKEAFEGTLEKCGKIGLLYIGKCHDRQEIMNSALQYTDNDSAIIIEGIGKDNVARALWQSAIDDPRTVVTYDMYSYGLILFDSEKKKQNYKLKR